jgi:hypothetical protein
LVALAGVGALGLRWRKAFVRFRDVFVADFGRFGAFSCAGGRFGTILASLDFLIDFETLASSSGL